ncbi:MAG: NAD(P)-binding domain-containing protein [Acidobacteriaceae bacterium]|nr:NAD(P)-binding domain-containing protein [Acidobacteriaceae bacterium]
MKIGIIGAGNVGTGLAKHLVAAGHQIMLSYSRDAAKLEAVAKNFGAQHGTVAEAVAFGDAVALATPYTANEDALKQAGSPAEKKVLWDCTNPLKPDFSGLLIGTTTSAGEQTAALAPWAKVVKAIPPFAEVLHSDSMEIGGEKAGSFVCGDDKEARELVAGLVRDLGAEPVIAGGLVLSRYVEPANMLLVALAYGNGFGPRIGLTLRRG